MKTQISRQHTNAVAVQPQTMFHKEDRIKTYSSVLKLAILVAMVLTMTLSAAAGEIFYMVTQNNTCGTDPACDTNTLVSVNLSSLSNGEFAATPIGPTAEIRGLAYDTSNRTMYGITAQGVLVTVNLHSGATSPLLTLPFYPPGSIQNEWSGLTFQGPNNLYAVNAFGNNELVDIKNFASGTPTASLMGSTDFTNPNGVHIPQQILGLASSGGVLYGSDRSIDNIVTIDPNNASVSLPYLDTSGVSNLQEIGFDASGKLYIVFDHVASSDNAGLATFDFATGTATELGELPFQIDFNGCQGCGNGTYGAGGFAMAPSPEPGSILLLGTGALGLARYLRQRLLG